MQRSLTTQRYEHMTTKPRKTKDCLTDFFRRFSKSKALIEFAVVRSDTERMWRMHGIMPTGETLLRVRYFLELVGYNVEELLYPPTAEIVAVGRCVALNIVTTKDVLTVLGTRQPKAFYRYFYSGGNGITDQRLAGFKAIATAHQAELAQKIKQNRRDLQHLLGISPSDHNESDDLLVTDFATACSCVRTLGGKLLEGPVENRILMRQKMAGGPEPALHLTWETLNNLLSEKKGIT